MGQQIVIIVENFHGKCELLIPDKRLTVVLDNNNNILRLYLLFYCVKSEGMSNGVSIKGFPFPLKTYFKVLTYSISTFMFVYQLDCEIEKGIDKR